MTSVFIEGFLPVAPFFQTAVAVPSSDNATGATEYTQTPTRRSLVEQFHALARMDSSVAPTTVAPSLPVPLVSTPKREFLPDRPK